MYKSFINKDSYSKSRINEIIIRGFNKHNLFPMEVGFSFSQECNQRWFAMHIFIFSITISYYGKLFCKHKYVNKYGDESPYKFGICEKCKKEICKED